AQGYNTGGHFRVVLTGSRLECRLQSTTDSYTLQSSGGAVTAGQWHHVAVGFGGDGLRMYLDGVQVDSDGYAGGLGTSSGGTGNPEPWVFGADMEYSATESSSGWTDPFDGRIDDVRLYDRNLDADQVGDLFGGGDPRAVSPPIVEDTAGNGDALDLTIEDPENVTWVSGGGLQIDSTTRVVSAGPATGLHTALTGSGTYTVEVEFTPLNLTQHGPAFMAFYGTGLSNRSFAVGQRQQKHNAYARTAFYANGTPEAESSDVLTTARQHLVMTYDGEELRLLRDGVTEATTPRDGNLGNWDVNGTFALANAVGDNRPWLGTLHRVAIWDGSVDQVQAQNLFNGDPPGPAAEDDEGLTYRVEWIEGP
ncbi:MAG: LamG domain-containing protein, partial [Planctomycetota bacterium]